MNAVTGSSRQQRKGTSLRWWPGRVGLLITMLWLARPPIAAAGISPHEVLVLVNANSQASIAVANHFVAARDVPTINVIYLDLPASVLRWEGRLTPKGFTERIWEPTWQAVRERGLQRQIRAWVYSADFPTRITHKPAISLTGITFVRNQLPTAEQIGQARYGSPYFLGPAQAGGPEHPPTSVAWYQDKIGETAPLPAMMLGYTGTRGNTLNEVLDSIQRGRRSDHTRPEGRVYFVTRDDVRSQAREWQYGPVLRELKGLGLKASAVTRYPGRRESTIGILSANRLISDRNRFGFLPGAMAEHLTSHAAAFSNHYQTKLSYWIRKGATASCGTVQEPYALWPKFPHARFFSHYGAGCSMIESFYLSIASPLQILLVGEPLARPFANPLVAVWDPEIKDEPNVYGVRIEKGANESEDYACQFLVDGVALTPFQEEFSIRLPDEKLIPGEHELRAVVVSLSPVRRWTQLARTVAIERGDVRIDLDLADDRDPVILDHHVALTIACTPAPQQIEIVKGVDRIALVSPGQEDVSIPARLLGLGPSLIQAVARYPDGRAVRSETRVVEVVSNDTPLSIRAVRMRQEDETRLAVEPSLSGWDPQVAGTLDVYTLTSSGGTRKTLEGDGTVKTARNDIALTSSQKFNVCLVDGLSQAGLSGLSTTIRWKNPLEKERAVSAGIAFNYRDPTHYDVFGLYRGWGIAFASRNGDAWTVHEARGMPISLEESYSLTVESDGAQGLHGKVAGSHMLHWRQGALQELPIGFFVGKDLATRFTPLGARLASLPYRPGEPSLVPYDEGPLRVFVRQGSRWAEFEAQVP